MTGSDNYRLLISKLDSFIRKYYINLILKGGLHAAAFILIAFLSVTIAEHFFYFGTSLRKLFFWSFLLSTGFILWKLLILPYLKYLRLGSVISHSMAAAIVGNHFPEVKDKLLNVLQLKEQSQSSGELSLLITAGIDQKAEKLKFVPFQQAIDLSANKKYLKFALPPFFVLLILLFASPSLITRSSKRLIHNGTDFERPAPFHFQILNALKAVQFEDLNIDVKVTGDMLPDEVYINFDNRKILLQKVKKNLFRHKFQNVQRDIKFYLFANGFNSKTYLVNVEAKPSISRFDVYLEYPSYLGKKNEGIQNAGDMVIPEGTKVKWQFNAQNSEQVIFKIGDNKFSAEGDEGSFKFNKQFNNSADYIVLFGDEGFSIADSVQYTLTVIPDQHPRINVEQFPDSLQPKHFYFSGDASDDYGLSKMTFNYQVLSSDNKSPVRSSSIKLKAKTTTDFTYFFDFSTLDIKAGETVNYYFEVWDNDGVNGNKSARSGIYTYQVQEYDLLKEEATQQNESFKQDMVQAIQDVKKLQNEMSNLEKSIKQKKQPTWEDKKSVEDLIKKEKNLQKKLEELQKDYAKVKDIQNDLVKDPELMEKQEELQKLMDELLSDDMKELMKKLEELMKNLNKKEALDELEKSKLTNEEVKKELDRMLSLFKQLEFEQNLNRTIDELQKLSEKQEEVQKATENQKGNLPEDLKNEQKKINEEFKEIDKAINELEKTAEELGMKEEFEKTKEKRNEIQNDLNSSQEMMNQGKSKKAGESQQNAKEEMKELSQQLAEMKESMEEEQAEIDIKALRQIMKNILKLSFDQEALINEVGKTNINSPEYVSLIQKQHKLKDDTKMVEDSLIALSNRVFEIQTFVNEQLTAIKSNTKKSIEYLEARNRPFAGNHQQYTMTHFNNLGLMLNESLQKMQQQANQKKQGNQSCSKPGSCKKPGSGSPKMKGMGKMQKELNDHIGKMQQMMKDGKMPGGQQLSKEFAQMAAKQAAIRKALQQMSEELGEDKESKGLQKQLEELIKQMDETERDLVNKRINPELINRQQEIETRLLEAEDADKERETDKERESQGGKEMPKSVPPSLEEYLRKKNADVSMYKSTPANFKPYYKKLVDGYYKSINTKNN